MYGECQLVKFFGGVIYCEFLFERYRLEGNKYLFNTFVDSCHKNASKYKINSNIG